MRGLLQFQQRSGPIYDRLQVQQHQHDVSAKEECASHIQRQQDQI